MNRHDWDDDERSALEPVREELAAIRERHRDDPPFDVLRAARADALPEPLKEAATAHLERGAWSRTLVDGADEVVPVLDVDAQERILRRVHADARRESRRPGRFRAWLWAPALSAAVIVVAVVVLRRPASPRPAIASAPAPAPAVQPVPAFHLPLDKPDVRFTATALVLRGSSGGPRFIDVVAPGIRAYRSGDYSTAEHELAALQTRYPSSVEVFFYLGVSRLFLGDAAGARTALDSARRVSDDQFGASVDWYLAVADERGGRLADAQAALGRLCAGTSEYRAKACEAGARIGSK